jgi:hypothetical protein
MATNQYPIDFSALYKGQFLSPEFLEEAVGVGRHQDYDLYKFLVLRIQKTIHDTTTLTAKFENDGLRILTDPEASVYNRRRFEINLGGAGRAAGRLQNVDSANLNSFQRDKHDHSLVVTGSCMLAIKDTKKKFIIGNSRKPKEIAEPVKINQSDENEKEQVQ